MPSFSEFAGVLAGIVLLAFVSGHGDWIWKEIAETRRMAVVDSHQSWGFPSIFSASACQRYGHRMDRPFIRYTK